ncbi:MAG: sulfatase-like hydrolase/transferase [Deltaproteobacteria bacterium]|nr:sulfatase-like hydrolase/transferase [Deltaproteobacteria bacterium]
MADDGNSKRIDRRSFLIGATGGAVVTALGAKGLLTVQEKTRKLRTPEAVGAGQAAEVAESFADSRPAYAGELEAPAGAPNIVVIVIDDVGFSDLGVYGSEIRTPNMDALAKDGLQYTNFRTCAMCSPTRAALNTGLNHHSAGMGWLADLDSGYPGYRGDLTLEAATTAEVLRDAGWSTLHVGKWHMNVAASCSAVGPYHNWPTNRGFERAFWFQGHSTDYFKPSELIDGVSPVEHAEKDDYYALDDLTDRAIAYVRTQKTLTPNKPFFLQVAYPAAHSPLQVRARDRDAYHGMYDQGWDVVRKARLERQRKLGVVPETSELPPLSPGAEPWDTLTDIERRVYSRYMEVYAGLVSSLDANIGRLLTSLEEIRERENTLVVLLSDNGASAEGTPTGTPNVLASALGYPIPVEKAAEFYDTMGQDETFPHYPIGWSCASNTPFRMYKQYTHLGGVADPLIISWPKQIAARGQVRRNFVHVIDLYPTILEAVGVKRPDVYRGRRLKPLEGASIVATFTDAAAPTRTSQYFELGGQRAYLDGNWRLVTRHERGKPFEDDVWELYDLSKDPNELHDLAAKMPDKVSEMVARWTKDAEKYGAFPLDDRNLIIKMAQDRQRRGTRKVWEFHPPVERLSAHTSPYIAGCDHTITVDIERAPGRGDGVLLACGSKHAGYTFFIHGGKLRYEQSAVPFVERIESSETLPDGPLTVRYVQKMTARPFEGTGSLYIGDRKVAEHTFNRVLLVTSYDGFSLGADLGNQVSTLYKGANPFQGKLLRARFDIDPAPFTPLESMRFLQALGIRV